MMLASNLVYANVVSAENHDIGFIDNVQYNLNKSDEKVFVSYSVSYDGKIDDISIIKSSSTEFDEHVIDIMKKTVQSYDNQTQELANTKKYIGNVLTRFAVNLYEWNKTPVMNKKNFYTANISYKPAYIYNSRNYENTKLEKYIETLNSEERKIAETLPAWNSIGRKTIFVYVKLNRKGEVEDTKILQSCGSTDYDNLYLEKIKNHIFTIPDSNISDDNLGFVFSAKPLKQEKYKALNSYRRGIERILYYAAPYSHNIKPTTIMLEVTILRSGKLKNVKLLETTYSKSYDEKLIQAFKKTSFEPFPSALNTNELTFIVRIRKNAQYYPQIDDRNYTSKIVLD